MVIKNISNLLRFFYDFVALIDVLNSSYNFGLLSAIQDVIYSFPCLFHVRFVAFEIILIVYLFPRRISGCKFCFYNICICLRHRTHAICF